MTRSRLAASLLGFLFPLGVAAQGPPEPSPWSLKADMGLVHERTPEVEGLKTNGLSWNLGARYSLSRNFALAGSIGGRHIGSSDSRFPDDSLRSLQTLIRLETSVGTFEGWEPYVAMGGGMARVSWGGSEDAAPAMEFCLGLRFHPQASIIRAVFVESTHEVTWADAVFGSDLPNLAQWSLRAGIQIHPW